MLNNSQSLQDLKTPLGNRLEKLRGAREGQYSIRINDQRRVWFVWRKDDAYEFWLGLQAQYDLDVEKEKLGEKLNKEVRVYKEDRQ